MVQQLPMNLKERPSEQVGDNDEISGGGHKKRLETQGGSKLD